MDKEKPIQKLLNQWEKAYKFALERCTRRKRWKGEYERK